MYQGRLPVSTFNFQGTLWNCQFMRNQEYTILQHNFIAYTPRKTNSTVSVWIMIYIFDKDIDLKGIKGNYNTFVYTEDKDPNGV